MSVKCTKNNLYAYIDYLVDAFLFYKVPIHSRSEKSRLVNPAKIYTIDTGLLNAMIFRNSKDFMGSDGSEKYCIFNKLESKMIIFCYKAFPSMFSSFLV